MYGLQYHFQDPEMNSDADKMKQKHFIETNALIAGGEMNMEKHPDLFFCLLKRTSVEQSSNEKATFSNLKCVAKDRFISCHESTQSNTPAWEPHMPTCLTFFWHKHEEWTSTSLSQQPNTSCVFYKGTDVCRCLETDRCHCRWCTDAQLRLSLPRVLTKGASNPGSLRSWEVPEWLLQLCWDSRRAQLAAPTGWMTFLNGGRRRQQHRLRWTTRAPHQQETICFSMWRFICIHLYLLFHVLHCDSL